MVGILLHVSQGGYFDAGIQSLRKPEGLMAILYFFYNTECPCPEPDFFFRLSVFFFGVCWCHKAMKQGPDTPAAEKFGLFQIYAFTYLVPQRCLLTLGNVTRLLKIVCAFMDLTFKDPVSL